MTFFGSEKNVIAKLFSFLLTIYWSKIITYEICEESKS